VVRFSLKGTLTWLGIRGFKPTLRKAAERLEGLRTPDDEPVPANTQAELKRDMARLRLVKDQIKRCWMVPSRRLLPVAKATSASGLSVRRRTSISRSGS